MPRQLFSTLRILSIGRWRPITVSLLLSAFCLIGMTVVLNAQTNPTPHQLSNIKQNTFSLEQLTTTANDEFTLYWISPDAKNTSRIAWGDADGDGDLDLAVSNREQINQLYLNDGAKNFSPSDLGPEVRASTSIAWGDADGDGDLDLAVGNINTYDLDCFCYLPDGINQLYINDGSGHFTAFDLGTESRHTESIAWGDADGDGDLDLAVGNYEGYPCYCGVSQLFINDGSGHFTARDLDPAAKPTTTIAWGDADNDGDLDLAVGNENEINQLYYNDGTGHFTPVDLGTEVQQTTALAWGDVDNDGDLDLAVGNLATWVTSDYENGETQLYLNDGLGNLMVVSDTLGIASSRTTSIMWGDADNDGDLDLAVGNTSQTDQLYLNNGTGSFTSTLNISDLNTSTTDVAWGDIDGDGDLDLAAANTSNQPNIVYINIDDSSFAKNPIVLTYQQTNSIAWGDIDGDGDLDLAAGNGARNFAQLNELYLNNDGISYTIVSNAFGTSVKDTRTLAWGDVDGDGDLDIAFGNVGGGSWTGPSSGDINELYLNNGGAFTPSLNAFGTETDYTLSIAWGDADNDGDLDLAVGNSGNPNRLYLNDGTGNFTQAENAFGIETNNTTTIAWGDADNDGDLDLAVGNWNQPNQLYFNNGAGNFVPTNISADTKPTRSLAWGDVNGDGNLDLAVGYGESEISPANQLYLNDGTGHFVLVENAFPFDTKNTRAIAWGDTDGDGDLDLVVGNQNQVNQLYINDGSGTFTNHNLGVTSYGTSSIALGDADGDGDLDLATGNFESNELFLNQAQGGQTLTNNLFSINVSQPNTSAANFYASPQIFSNSIISIPYTLADFEGEFVGRIEAKYSPDGGGRWLSAVPSTTTATSNLATGNHIIRENVSNINQFLDGSVTHIASLQITETFEIADLDIHLTISHTWDSDLNVFLKSPSGTVVELFTNVGGQDDHFIGTYLSDQASTSIIAGTAPFTGSYKPEGTLADFNGEPTQGEWQLQIVDIYPAADTGTLVSWGLVFKTLPKEHIFEWNTFASGFFGQSDNVVFRLEAYPQPETSGTAGSYQYVNSTPFPIQRPYASAVTFPFRVRGTQVQVFSETISTENAVPDALVYQQSGSGLGQPMANEGSAVPFTTDSNGYLSGRGQLAIGDNLFAALPMTTTYRTPPQLIFGGADSLGTVGLHAPPASAATAEFWLLPTAADGDLFTLGGLTLANPSNLTINGQTTGISVDDGFPHHVALSWQDSGGWELVVDGNSVANGTANTSLSSSLTIGNGYSGSLDEIRLWNVVRSSGQISATLFTSLSGTEAGLVGYWPVEASDSGIVADHSGNGNDLSLSGDASVTFKPLYTVYHTSGAPTPSGVAMFEVTEPGVQQLVVSKNNPLMLFDLIVSLEWDASGDPDYLERLEQDIGRASEILYDLTNGQVAFGTVQVYQNKEQWHEADIQIYANNNQRPNANLGGIVTNILSDTLKTGEVVGNAFVPGKIRIGATWNRYGNPGGTVGEDWPRVMAHEFGHYALFLLDNYLGVATVNGNKIITEIDCAGSAMTDAYRQDYSEFLSEVTNSSGNSWSSSECPQSLAEDTTGRSDWETIQTFYPFLNENIATTQTGPTSLPLAVTQVSINTPDNGLTLLDTPVFYITDDMGNLIPFTRGEGQAYLYQKQGTIDPEDDEVLFLGSPSGPLVNARGAAVGDKLCVYDNGHVPPRVGCLDNLDNSDATLVLQEVNNWLPEITVRPVNSTTLAVTVTQASATNIHIQLFPSYRPTETVEALTGQLTDIGNNTYVGQFEFPLTVFDGYARVWQDGRANNETISRFANAPGWDGNRFVGFGGNTFVGFGGNRFVGFGGNRFVGFGGNTFVGFGGNRFVGFGGNTFVGFGGNRFVGFGGNTFVGFNAPLASPDGQVILYNVDNILAGNVASSLQVLPTVPQLPAWLTPVGQVYRYTTQENEGDNLVIQFQYLQRELPAIEEEQLKIYYLDEDDPTAEWQRIENTTIDDFRNLASAKMYGEGLYALVATVELPRFYDGWNNFGYPINEPRPVGEALASIEGAYTSIYHYDAAASTWLLYDATVINDQPSFAPLVNTLTDLETNKGYWLYATEKISAYLGVADNSNTLDPLNQQFPPATYYGYIQPNGKFQPTAGLPVTVWVDGVNCGVGEVVHVEGQLAYQVQVQAENTAVACGNNQRLVNFQVGDWWMAHQPTWDNSQAHFLTLSGLADGPPSNSAPVYLPIIIRP